MDTAEIKREEERLERLRENSRRYYRNHKLELSEKRKSARAAKLEAMTPEEREILREKNRLYQAAYRKANPQKVALWTAKTWLRKLEKCGKELADNGQ